MDEEDILDSQKEFKVPKINDGRFKINFSGIFILCIVIMSTDQIMKYLDYYPELFYGADYIFHILQSVINICSQLAVSVAAAIIFYYVLEFINEKKKINNFVEIRKYMLFILYNHMKIICNTESFKNLNRNKRRLQGPIKSFFIVDIPILLECYNNCDKEIFKMELRNYFFKVHKDSEGKRLLMILIKNLGKEVENLLEYKDFSFYKGYTEDIEELTSIYENMNEYVDYYNNEKDACSLYSYTETIVDNYIDFLDESIHTYHIIERYIECLKEKNFIEFMKMLG